LMREACLEPEEAEDFQIPPPTRLKRAMEEVPNAYPTIYTLVTA